MLQINKRQCPYSNCHAYRQADANFQNPPTQSLNVSRDILKLSIIYNMVTVTLRCKKPSIRFNSQQSSIASLFEHYRIEI